jgi:hypothetical protein
MSDTPADPPEYIQGPGPDYDPPPLDTLRDPALHEHTHTEGRDLVLAVLAEECGIRKRDDGKWDTPNSIEGARR